MASLPHTSSSEVSEEDLLKKFQKIIGGEQRLQDRFFGNKIFSFLILCISLRFASPVQSFSLIFVRLVSLSFTLEFTIIVHSC